MKRGHFPLVRLGRRPLDRGRHHFRHRPLGPLEWSEGRRPSRSRCTQRHQHAGTSPTGNIHGMPLAALLGLGAARAGRHRWPLQQGGSCKHRVGGIRSVDEGNGVTLKRLGVNVYTMADIDRQDIHSIMEKALATSPRVPTHRPRELRPSTRWIPVWRWRWRTVKAARHREAHLIIELVAAAG